MTAEYVCAAMTDQADLLALQFARAAALKAARSVFVNNYIGGRRTISRREPDADSWYLSSFSTSGYAEQRICSTQTALRDLRKLAAAGLLIEEPRRLAAYRFRVTQEEHVAMGAAIIEELRSQGLQYDDDWRARRDAAGGAQ